MSSIKIVVTAVISSIITVLCMQAFDVCFRGQDLSPTDAQELGDQLQSLRSKVNGMQEDVETLENLYGDTKVDVGMEMNSMQNDIEELKRRGSSEDR